MNYKNIIQQNLKFVYTFLKKYDKIFNILLQITKNNDKINQGLLKCNKN